jgi:hypothetical protein
MVSRIRIHWADKRTSDEFTAEGRRNILSRRRKGRRWDSGGMLITLPTQANACDANWVLDLTIMDSLLPGWTYILSSDQGDDRNRDDSRE